MNKSGLNVTSLSLISAGVFMIWCGFTNRNPIEVMKSIMSGDYKNLPKAGSWATPLAIGGGTFPKLPSDQPKNDTPPPPNVMV